MLLKPRTRTSLFLLCVIMCVVVASPVSAHANLIRSNPPANTSLATSPTEIRMWFTEPLEEQYNRLVLRDTRGNVISTPPAQNDPLDPMQMYVIPGELPQGLYTVSWRVVSTADGHPTQGSFAFGVGTAVTFEDISVVEEPVPADSAAVRWLNVLTMALGVGSLGFYLFVWSPAVTGTNSVLERRLIGMAWIGWVLLGIAGVLALLLQVSVSNGVALINAVDGTLLTRIISSTRYGNLWLIRTALWLGFGLALLFARGDRWFYWIAMALGGGILLTNSLYSHASGMPNTQATVAADWIHLLASTLWIGGLVQIVNVLSVGRRGDALLPTPDVSGLVNYFSNYARVCVSILVLTGLYASWLHVGSIDGLLTTQYGQALLVKLILFLPLVGLAAVNLMLTAQRLQAGEVVWVGRLRGLVSAEILLTVSVLVAVGVMTAIAPARNVLTNRAAAPPAPRPIVATQTADDLNIQLQITPGWVGSNTFNVTLTDADGNPITDATRIRLRFTSGDLGESELRPEHLGNGIYSVIGDNLSITGEWRIRTTVARPQEFDAVVDFAPTVDAAPAPPPPPNPIPPLSSRIFALLLTGVAALGIGGFFSAQNGLHLRTGEGILTVGLLALGVVFVGSGLLDMRTPTAAASADQQESSTVAVNLAIREGMALPYVLTGDGQVLQPQDDATWTSISPANGTRDIYLNGDTEIIAAADGGMHIYDGMTWRSIEATPLRHVESMHGYLFALGNNQVLRFHELPGFELDESSKKLLLESDEPLGEMVMLGDHSHALQVGGSIVSTPDLGLSWEPLDNPFPATALGVDVDGKLLVVTENGVMRRSGGAWEFILPLPEESLITDFRVFNDNLYAVASGRLYVQAGEGWSRVEQPEGLESRVLAITVQYPQTLWVLDGMRVWSTTDGDNWTVTPIVQQ